MGRASTTSCATACARRASDAPCPKRNATSSFAFIAALDGHFAAADVSEADADKWCALKRHLVHMKDALDLVETTLRHLRERGIPLTDDEARKIEGYARFGLGEKSSSASEK